MRDAETAEIAVRAALTGHLVLSTVHTTDAVGALARLRDMGVPPYLITATLQGVLAQRLVRRLCDQCAHDVPPEALERAFFGPAPMPSTLRLGAGCATCAGTGFRGRLAIAELVSIDDLLRDALTHGATTAELREIVRGRGIPSLADDGRRAVRDGLTTASEVTRVVSEALT
jgi:type II secretory ATPase GspE/PulE/Tfp pilus assembly ATPase PilB-like protein